MKGKSSKQPVSYSDVGDYGPQLTDLEPKFSPSTLEFRQRALSQEQPFIEHFEYRQQAGFAMVSVVDGDVRAEIYDGTQPSQAARTVSLSKLLA